ncbi:hypothetical protein K439DRAFT_1319042, partial [Ramaria rubella]
HEKQQLLTNAQMAVLIEWCKHKAQLGEPYTRETLTKQVVALSGGRTPRQKQVSCFLEKHAAELEASKGHGLDPKRVRAFSKPIITNHFQMLGEILTQYDIPLENIYIEDEKGLQLG